ncbi:MAG: peroxidase [Chloroflexi bacterium]|nr:MAG: peroxidase [Chloroflexota bacterium]MBL1195314.1 peroxidase [Chloroflexota bacterium]NOH12598.1 peroxidase [Chloroflexota bacterium]
MAWIKMVPEDEASGRLKELYAQYTEPWGGVDNIMKIHSLNPKSMKTHFDLYAHLMRGKSDLSRVQREMIAIVTSVTNHCHY